MAIRYFANLGDDNAVAIAQDPGSRDAVLCAGVDLSARVSRAARSLTQRGLALAADNGNAAHVAKLMHSFAEPAARLARLREAAKLGENDPFPAELLREHQSLARKIAVQTRSLASLARQEDVLRSQMTLAPEFFTCLEDLAMPVLIGLDLEPARLGTYAKRLIRLQDRGTNAANAVLAGRMGPITGIPYVTVHAFDYDSAFSSGARAGGITGAQAIATGLASFLTDRNYVRGYRIRGKHIACIGGRSIPNRYLRSLLVTMGLLDGFASVRDGAFPRFHGLGAGAPMILPLLALCGYSSPSLSVDSTSPEKNASVGEVFSSIPAPATLSVSGIAQALVDGRRIWDCPCPACRNIMALLPFDLAGARAFYQAHIAPKRICDADLEMKDGIGAFLSFCSQDRGHPAAAAIRRARTEHSHWALHEITQELQTHSGTFFELKQCVSRLCEAYKMTVSGASAAQIDECMAVIELLREQST